MCGKNNRFVESRPQVVKHYGSLRMRMKPLELEEKRQERQKEHRKKVYTQNFCSRCRACRRKLSGDPPRAGSIVEATRPATTTTATTTTTTAAAAARRLRGFPSTRASISSDQACCGLHNFARLLALFALLSDPLKHHVRHSCLFGGLAWPWSRVRAGVG